MGLFDFFKSRENDFVKLETTTAFGPPVIILYNVPNGILNDEIQDMIEDGTNSLVQFTRIDSKDLDWIGQMSVQEVLDRVESNDSDFRKNVDKSSSTSRPTSRSNIPILYFSGIPNEAMLQTYNIIAREIYEESGGVLNAACAKAVEPAMKKPFCKLIEEISGDHADATQEQ